MQKLTNITSVAAVLPMDNIDTDQIMPKQFLRGIDKSGLALGAFYNMRFSEKGTPNSDCVFNRPGFENARILVAGPNFGCGSSREHAVWGMMQMGLRAVIAPRYGEIFYSNCFNNGLLAAKVSMGVYNELIKCVSETSPVELSVNVAYKTISCGERVWGFELGARHQRMLLEGMDMVDATLADMEAIRQFVHQHEQKFPWMAGLAGKAKRKLIPEA